MIKENPVINVSKKREILAKKFDIEIIQVIENENGNTDLPFLDKGVLVNSGEFDGLDSETAKIDISNYCSMILDSNQKHLLIL